jgi:hypothetical protein
MSSIDQDSWLSNYRADPGCPQAVQGATLESVLSIHSDDIRVIPNEQAKLLAFRFSDGGLVRE